MIGDTAARGQRLQKIDRNNLLQASSSGKPVFPIATKKRIL